MFWVSVSFLFSSENLPRVFQAKTFVFIIEVIIDNKILNPFDTSHDFWDLFDARTKDLRKKLGYLQLKTLITRI